MSVDYSAKMAVGIVVKPDEFFFETKQVTKVICDHPEGARAGTKFCPVCGVKASKRVKATTKKVLKKEFAEAEDYGEEFPHDCPYPIAGLSLIVLDWNPYGDHTYVFGAEIGKAGGYGPSGTVCEDAERTVKTIARVADALTALGIAEKPQTFLALSAS